MPSYFTAIFGVIISTNFQSFDSSKTLNSKEEFYEFLQTFENSNTRHYWNFIAFICSRLNHFNLASRYEWHEIRNIAICRAIEKFDKDQSIKNPLAWLRSTSFNIIRELSREDSRWQLTAEYSEIECQMIKLTLPEENSEKEELTKVIADIKRGLKPEEQKILELRVEQDMTWKQVRQQLETQGIQTNEPALRKKWQRMCQRLEPLKELYLTKIDMN